MTNVLAPVADKLGKLLRLLSSDRDGEIVGTARAIMRTLDGAGLDIHALAEGIDALADDKKKFSEADALEIYRRGVEDGKRAAESENVGLPQRGRTDVARDRVRVRGERRASARRTRAAIRPRHGATDGARRRADRQTGALAAGDLRAGATMNMSDRPRTFNGDLQRLPAALLPLTQEERFVVWRWEWRARKGGGGRWTKPPYQTRYPKEPAKSNDPATWGRHQDAVAAVTAGAADGIGFMLKDASVGAVDLDHVRDPDTGELVGWAEALSAEANGAYCEPTVSGSGLRLIGVARGSEIHRKFTFDRATGAGVELYRNCARYITISGLQLGECSELPVIDGLLDTLFARYSVTGEDRQANGHDFNDAGRQQSSIDYDDLIRNGAPEGQRSELFQAVVWHLAAKGRTAEQITDELARHPDGIGAKYADRLHAEVARSYEKWRSRQHAAATGGAAAGSWPQIYIKSGELPRVVNEAEDALLLLGREIYQRGGLVVRPVLTKLKAADDRDMPRAGASSR